MNTQQLAAAALLFEEQLQKYAMDDPDVSKLAAASFALIGAAKAGTITAPMDWRDIPGSYWFTEGALGKFGALESAYAEFKIALSGGPSPVLRALQEKMRKP